MHILARFVNKMLETIAFFLGEWIVRMGHSFRLSSFYNTDDTNNYNFIYDQAMLRSFACNDVSNDIFMEYKLFA